MRRGIKIVVKLIFIATLLGIGLLFWLRWSSAEQEKQQAEEAAAFKEKILKAVIENETHLSIFDTYGEEWELVCVLTPYLLREFEQTIGKKTPELNWANADTYWGIVFVSGENLKTFKYNRGDYSDLNYSKMGLNCWRWDEARENNLRFVKSGVNSIILRGGE